MEKRVIGNLFKLKTQIFVNITACVSQTLDSFTENDSQPDKLMNCSTIVSTAMHRRRYLTHIGSVIDVSTKK